MGRPDDTAAAFRSMLEARKVVGHSPVALMSIRRVGFCGVPCTFTSIVCPLARPLCILVCTKNDRNRPWEATSHTFHTAWDKRNFSEMWGLAYRLSGRPVGPKKRVYYQMASSSLSVQEWSEFLSLAGHLGGSGAQVANSNPGLVSRVSGLC